MVQSFQAAVTSISVAEGGKPFGPGYRALLHYNSSPDGDLHAVTVNPAVGFVSPGETVLCTIRFLYPDYNKEWARTDSRFELRDGETVRAIGVVTVVDSD